MAAPHKAAIQRQAQIAQAMATQQSVRRRAVPAERKQGRVRPPRPRSVQAQYKAEVDRAQAQAAQAGPLSQAEAQRQVIAAQTELAERAGELRQQQLVAEVVRPAEAEANASASSRSPTPSASASRPRPRRPTTGWPWTGMIIDQLPLIVEKAAAGLQGAKHQCPERRGRSERRSRPGWSGRGWRSWSR